MTKTCFFCSSALANAASARRLSFLRALQCLFLRRHRRQQLSKHIFLSCEQSTGSLHRLTAVHHRRSQSAIQIRRSSN